MNRKILLLLGFLFLSSALFSQPGVVINYANGMHNRASNAVNTPDGGFLILMNSSDIAPGARESTSSIQKYDTHGHLVSEIFLDQFENSYMMKVIAGKDSLYRTVGIATFQGNDTAYFVSQTVSDENELLSEMWIPLDTLFLGEVICDISNDEYFIVSTYLDNYGQYASKGFNHLLKIKWDYSDYEKTMLSNKANDMINSMCVNPSGDKYYATAWGYSQGPGNPITKLMVIDTSLTIDTIQNFFDFTYKGRSVHFVNDTLLRYVTRTHEISGDEQNALLEQTVDHQETDRLVYGSDGYDDEPAVYQTIRRNSDGSYWAFYFKNYTGSTLFPYDHPSWIEWQKISDSLTLEEKYFYGGDAYYFLFDVSTANDSGMLVTATRYDWNVGYPYTDAIVLKINPDGLLCSAPGQPPTQPHHAIVYPNPGHDVLKVEAGPQIFGATFELFDMGGQRVAMQTLQTSVTAINTAPLTSGVYPWRIVWKGEVVEEGKWVKE